jgi:hypothetical protein
VSEITHWGYLLDHGYFQTFHDYYVTAGSSMLYFTVCSHPAIMNITSG